MNNQYKEIEIGKIAEHIRNGLSLKQTKEKNGLPITRIETIWNEVIDPDRVGYAGIKPGEKDSWLLKEGDILISHINSKTHLGKCALYASFPEKLIHGMNLLCLRSDKNKAVPNYLIRILQSPEFRAKIPSITKDSVNQSSFNVTNFRKLTIPTPPLAEQKRIAAILDKAGDIRRKRQEAIKLADDFLRATFLDMFGDPVTNPKGWDKKKIEELSIRVTKGESPKWQGFKYQDNGTCFITSENVLWGTLGRNKRKYIPEAFHTKLRRSQLKENDLLINLVGASVGRVCLVPPEVLPANINQAVSVTTLDINQVMPSFVLQQILTPQIQNKLLGNAVDFARANISLTNIRELELLVPPFRKQELWMELTSKATSTTEAQNAFSNKGTMLFNSFTQRAFRGEL